MGTSTARVLLVGEQMFGAQKTILHKTCDVFHGSQLAIRVERDTITKEYLLMAESSRSVSAS